jgi:hypothetical protein
MSIDPFIKAEEVKGRSVSNACRLLEVSRACGAQQFQLDPQQAVWEDHAVLLSIVYMLAQRLFGLIALRGRGEA